MKKYQPSNPANKKRSPFNASLWAILWFVLALILSITLPTAIARIPIFEATAQVQQDASQLAIQGKADYRAGRFAASVNAWQQAAAKFATQGDRLNQAMALSNLSLAHQQLGQWDRASVSIESSLNLLQTQSQTQEQLRVLAQSTDIQGRLLLEQGKAESALDVWQKAASLYARLNDKDKVAQNLINQSQALQSLGLYRRACKTVQQSLNLDDRTCDISDLGLKTLQQQPNSETKIVGMRSLGDILRKVGQLDRSKGILEVGLRSSIELNLSEEAKSTELSLGNTYYSIAQRDEERQINSKDNLQSALTFYKSAMQSALPETRIEARLNQLRLSFQLPELADNTEALTTQIQSDLAQLPTNQTAIYARLNLAQNLFCLKQQGITEAERASSSPLVQSCKISEAKVKASSSKETIDWKDIEQIINRAIEQSRSLQDRRAEAYALGYLGGARQLQKQFTDAAALTQQAVGLAKSFNAPDIAYLLQWQLGRLNMSIDRNTQNKDSLSYYASAYTTLQSLRRDLVAISSEVQFSFRDSVEPVYREYVDLLLRSPNQQLPNQENLKKAREAIESLQLAELEDFFRDACLDAKPVEIAKVDPTAAVIYPIILVDRLEVILSFPDQPLRHYSTPITQAQVDRLMLNMRSDLRDPSSSDYLPSARRLYDWLIRPAEADLAKYGIKTLVFVPDGTLRNIPLAVAHDGSKFLVEKFNVALTPGLQLLNPQPLSRQTIKALTAGLSESRQGFTALPNVESEIKEIKSLVPSQGLLNQSFTGANFQQAIKGSTFPVIHLATHGQFGSTTENTFLLTWDGRIGIEQLKQLIQVRSEETSKVVELLVLSACQTALGDKRAALGMAGMAVRAGTRSTVASLWSVSDDATASFMAEFYRNLASQKFTKAEMIKLAQLSLIKTSNYKHPFYWAPFVLLGNWL